MQHFLHSLQCSSRSEFTPKRGSGSLLMGPHLESWAPPTHQCSLLFPLVSTLTGKMPAGCHLDLARWTNKPHGCLRQPHGLMAPPAVQQAGNASIPKDAVPLVLLFSLGFPHFPKRNLGFSPSGEALPLGHFLEISHGLRALRLLVEGVCES